ncbi:MAG: ABC transporter substrate-binding protein [Thermodesulfovibrio sp.]|nr:ABC transporter substrate-binding protein [Thermodesulfovibrio sp.]
MKKINLNPHLFIFIFFIFFIFYIFLTKVESNKVFKLLIFDSQEGYPYNEVRVALLKSLRNFGYFEGKNLSIKQVFIGNDIDRGARILKEEIKNNYDVIVVGGTAATVAAKRALYGKSQPTVFASPTDPVGIGVIKDFESNPEANFTGVSYPVPVKARMKFIRQLMPNAKTFALIYADMPQSHSYRAWLEDLIKNDPEFRDIKIIFRSVPLVKGELGDIRMANMAKKYIKELDSLVDAYIKPCDQMGTRRYFSEVIYKNSKKPLIGLVKDDVVSGWGATAVVYPSHESIGEQASKMVVDIFNGKKVSEIKPEWPKKFGFAVDLKKAKKFGITIPVEILQLSGENIVR